MLRARKTWLVLGLALLVCAGCGKRRKANIVRHPEWQYQDYRRVAILPFQVNRPESVDAAREAEFYLFDLMANNGAFELVARSELAGVFTEQDLSRLADADPGTALPEGRIQIAQALIVGKITEFDLKREQRERRVKRYARDRRGRVIRDRAGRPVVVGEDVYVEYRHIARVGGNVQVIDAATSRVLITRNVPAFEKDAANWNTPPRATPEELAIDVAREVATEFYHHIAPLSIEVKLDGDCLMVASGYYEGRYDKIKKVPNDYDEILLVARDLPKSCDRNDFRLAISPEGRQEYLVQHEFTWSPSRGRRGEVVRVPVSLLREAGGEKFVAKLFLAGTEHPILEREFKLVEPDGD